MNGMMISIKISGNETSFELYEKQSQQSTADKRNPKSKLVSRFLLCYVFHFAVYQAQQQQQQTMQQNKEPNLLNFIDVEPFNHKTRIFKMNEQTILIIRKIQSLNLHRESK